jgi:hypothetical protein
LPDGTELGSAADPQAEIARLQAENDALRAGAPVPEQAAPVATPDTPFVALTKAMEANPDGTVLEHLKVLAEDGIKAVINPTDEHDVLRVLAAVVSDVVKVVKP